MLVNRHSVELKNCTLIGKHEKLNESLLEDCYIIPKEYINDITEHFQGVRHITTKPVWDGD